MSLDQVVTAVIYLAAVFIVFLGGKIVFDKLHRSFDLKSQLIKEDNFAVALAVVGYYAGLVFALGGILAGPAAEWWVDDIIDIVFWGAVAVVLMSLSNEINDRFILYKFDNTKEIVVDRNAGTGAILAGNYIAVGLMISGALSGEGGDLITAGVFWLLGQGTLVVAGILYNRMVPFDVHAEVEKDNVAVGVAFSGVLVAIGILARAATEGDFYSWQENLTGFAGVLVFGLVLLPIVRIITDRVLLPGEKLTDELVNQEVPNVGAGATEAFSYIAAALLVSWVL